MRGKACAFIEKEDGPLTWADMTRRLHSWKEKKNRRKKKARVWGIQSARVAFTN